MSDEPQETLNPLDDLAQEHEPAMGDPSADVPPPVAQSVDERVAALETRVENLITQNCLRESGR